MSNVGNSQFSFTPAAVDLRSNAGGMIYVRYRSHKKNRIRVISTSPTCTVVECPDRDLVISTDVLQSNPQYPSGGSYDECIAIHPFIDHSIANLADLEYIMVNFLNSGKTIYPSPNTFNHDRKVQIISDSGGFQLLQNIVSFINPEDLIEWYNRNVNLGMALDIPIYDDRLDVKQEKEFVLRQARIQKRCTDLMMDRKREDLELINIFHGRTPELLDQVRDICEDDRIDRCCVGGINVNTVFSGLEKWFSVMANTKKYQHVHILGVTNMAKLFPYLFATANLDFLPRTVTSDSSSYLALTNMGRYLVWRDAVTPMVGVSLMDPSTMYSTKAFNTLYSTNSASVSAPHSMKELACSCPVCSAVKYQEVFRLCTTPTNCMLAMHNLYTSSKFFTTVFDMLKNMTMQEGREYFQVLFPRGSSGNVDPGLYLKCLDFVQDMSEMPFKKVRKKWDYFLGDSHMINSTRRKNTLFGNLTSKQYDKDVAEQQRKETKQVEEDLGIKTKYKGDKRFSYLNSTLSMFEHFLKTGKVPKINRVTSTNKVKRNQFRLPPGKGKTSVILK